jgi:uncharacterized phage-like protein YoqJ
MIVAGTGHRPKKLLYGYSKENLDFLISIAEPWIRDNNVDKIISGMALGWDMALALTGLKLDKSVVAAIPFKGQESKWPQHWVRLYNQILSEVDKKIYVSEPGYSAEKMQIRNEWMVDNCNTVLALWNGSPGGTANCVKYAETVEKQIVNLWPEYKKKAEGEEDMIDIKRLATAWNKFQMNMKDATDKVKAVHNHQEMSFEVLGTDKIIYAATQDPSGKSELAQKVRDGYPQEKCGWIFEKIFGQGPYPKKKYIARIIDGKLEVLKTGETINLK